MTTRDLRCARCGLRNGMQRVRCSRCNRLVCRVCVRSVGYKLQPEPTRHRIGRGWRSIRQKQHVYACVQCPSWEMPGRADH